MDRTRSNSNFGAKVSAKGVSEDVICIFFFFLEFLRSGSLPVLLFLGRVSVLESGWERGGGRTERVSRFRGIGKRGRWTGSEFVVVSSARLSQL